MSRVRERPQAGSARSAAAMWWKPWDATAGRRGTCVAPLTGTPPTREHDMAENTKMPPNQDQRQRMPSSKPGDGKPQKSGGPIPSGAGPGRDRQDVNNPGKQVPEIDP